MWKTFKVNFLIERTNRSNLYSILVVALLILGYMYIAKDEQFNNPIVESTNEYQSLSSALSKFQVVDVNAVDENGNLYGDLTRLRQAVALKLAALKTDKISMLYTASDSIYDLRNTIYEQDGYEKISDLVPSPILNEREKVLMQEIKENNYGFTQNPLHFWPFLLAIFTFIGFAWFPFLSFYTSAIMIEDFSHSSIIKGYPVKFSQYVVAKSATKFLMIVSFIVLIFIISLPLLQWKEAGEANYPTIIYTGEVIALSIPQYIGLSIVFMILIAIFTLLLSIILNMLTKNMYLTMFIQMILYFLPILFPRLIALIPINPFHFLNYTMFLTGDHMQLANPIDFTFKGGLVIISVCILLMLVIVQRFISTGSVKRT